MADLTCGVSTGSEIIAEINDKVNKDGVKVLSANDFTDALLALLNLQSGTNTGDQDLSSYITLTSTSTLTNKTITDITNTIYANTTQLVVRATEAISKGEPVAFTGYNLGQEAIDVELADNTVNVSIGIASDDIALSGTGPIITNGVLTDVDTSSFSEGVILYVNGLGALTATEPTSGFAQPIAFVLRSHAINGVLLITTDYPKQSADDVRYDNSTSGLSATDTNAAIDEVEGRLDTAETKLSGIEAGATADQTGAEIKTAYELEPDTNAYTDAEKTKLSGIESSATADQTGAEIKTAYELEADTNAYTDAEKTKLTGIEASADANVIEAVLDDTTPQLGGDLDLNGKGIPLDYNAQTGTTYTAVLTDGEKIISMSNASANTLTIPANASVAYPVGTKLNILQLGAGATTVAITSDTLNVNANLTLVLNGQYAMATAVKVTSTTWVLFGNLVAS